MKFKVKFEGLDIESAAFSCHHHHLINDRTISHLNIVMTQGQNQEEILLTEYG